MYAHMYTHMHKTVIQTICRWQGNKAIYQKQNRSRNRLQSIWGQNTCQMWYFNSMEKESFHSKWCTKKLAGHWDGGGMLDPKPHIITKTHSRWNTPKLGLETVQSFFLRSGRGEECTLTEGRGPTSPPVVKTGFTPLPSQLQWLRCGYDVPKLASPQPGTSCVLYEVFVPWKVTYYLQTSIFMTLEDSIEWLMTHFELCPEHTEPNKC